MSGITEPIGMTEEQIAERLAAEEGRKVTALDVRKLVAIALRKLRTLMRERHLAGDDILPDED